MRMRFNFWLDLKKDDEFTLAESIEDLKRDRTFSRTIRDGIRLINDLRKGNTTVLLELFPWVLEKIALQIKSEHVESAPAVDVLQAQLNRMERYLLEQGAVPLQAGEMSTHIAQPRLSSGISLDDIELEIKEAGNSADNNSTWNFMISLAMQSKGNVNGLPQEAIDYGLRTGRIPKEMVTDKPKTTSPPTKQAAKGNPKAMDVPTDLPPPALDIDDFDMLDIPIVNSG